MIKTSLDETKERIFGAAVHRCLAGNIPLRRYFCSLFLELYVGTSVAFIGVPVPIAFIVYSAGTPSGKWVATLLSGGSNVDTNHGP